MPGKGGAAGSPTPGRPLVLLVQPPIHDFTAFDFFLYPLGLVQTAAALLERGYEVGLVDALDRFADLPASGGLKPPTFRNNGCGHFPRTRIPPPPHLAHVPRRYHRYGLPAPEFEARMQQRGRPDAVAVTCTMTYWYPGAREAVELARMLWPGIPVLLGGVYATLCPDHAARATGADRIFPGRDLEPALAYLEEVVGAPAAGAPAGDMPGAGRPGPDASAAGRADRNGHTLVGERSSAAVLSSRGCPCRCPYCAAHLLGGAYRRRPVDGVLREISSLVKEQGRRQIAFYDDALLADREGFFKLTEGLVRLGLHERATFHCPNGLSPSAIDGAVAGRLRAANFHTLRIGFETADPALQREWGSKATNEDLAACLDALRGAGYDTREIGVYVLMGLPDQDSASVEASLRFVHAAGAPARLAEYAPVPGTPLYERAKARSRLDLDEPLNHNKTLAPFRFTHFGLGELRRLKDLCHNLNARLLRGD